MVRFLYAVLHLGQSKLEVTVQGDDGRRRIEVQCFEKERSDLVPVTWPSSVILEVEFQRAEEGAEARGAKIPY